MSKVIQVRRSWMGRTFQLRQKYKGHGKELQKGKKSEAGLGRWILSGSPGLRTPVKAFSMEPGVWGCSRGDLDGGIEASSGK